MSKPLKYQVRNDGVNKNADPTMSGSKASTSGSELLTEDNSQHQVGYIDYAEWKEKLCI